MPETHPITQHSFLQTFSLLWRYQTRANIYHTVTIQPATLLSVAASGVKMFIRRVINGFSVNFRPIPRRANFLGTKHILQMEMSECEPHQHKQMTNYSSVGLLQEKLTDDLQHRCLPDHTVAVLFTNQKFKHVQINIKKLKIVRKIEIKKR